MNTSSCVYIQVQCHWQTNQKMNYTDLISNQCSILGCQWKTRKYLECIANNPQKWPRTGQKNTEICRSTEHWHPSVFDVISINYQYFYVKLVKLQSLSCYLCSSVILLLPGAISHTGGKLSSRHIRSKIIAWLVSNIWSQPSGWYRSRGILFINILCSLYFNLNWLGVDILSKLQVWCPLNWVYKQWNIIVYWIHLDLSKLQVWCPLNWVYKQWNINVYWIHLDIKTIQISTRYSSSTLAKASPNHEQRSLCQSKEELI